VKRFFAVTAPGLESITAGEIAALGGGEVKATRGGVGFVGPLELGFRANLWLRTAVEVRMRLHRFHAPAERLLARRAGEVAWGEVLGAGGAVSTVAVSSTRSALRDERRIAELVREGWPSGAGDTAGQKIYVRLVQDTCTISIDMSGERLDRRGYRQERSLAPLRETLAAALILALEWDGTTAFVDPMCGSGTLPIEAALIALDMAPGLGRSFACERWPQAEPEMWAALRAEARARMRTVLRAPILGSDRNAGALGVARRNAARAEVAEHIQFERRFLADLLPPPEDVTGLVLTNPPYGRRIGEQEEASAIYAELGRVLRERFSGWRAAFVSTDRRHDRAVGLPVRQEVPFAHGGLKCRLVEIDCL
jgi:putative N6-adenine-specific DNA methylase